MVESINYALLLTLVGIALYVLVLRESPRALKYLAVWALSRARALEQFRRTGVDERRRWEAKLGIAAAKPQLVQNQREIRLSHSRVKELSTRAISPKPLTSAASASSTPVSLTE